MLVYTTDSEPGIRRIGAGRGFYYRDSSGEKVTAPTVLNRIGQLAIPPAYRDVWICELENGHLQATGLDSRKRKQYRYHPDWLERQKRKKFETLPDIGKRLPRLRRRVRRDLRDFQGQKHQVVAAAVRIIDKLGFRVGNEIYLKENSTRGISTLSVDNVTVDRDDSTIALEYQAKGGREISEEFSDRLLSDVLVSCQEIPGQRLFTYKTGSGDIGTVDSGDINAYLQESLGSDATAKSLRTWRASVEAVEYLRKIAVPEDRSAEYIASVRQAAEQIENRYETCREYYIHPAIEDVYKKSGKWGISRLRPASTREFREAESLFLKILED